jgi:hypothetical protein
MFSLHFDTIYKYWAYELTQKGKTEGNILIEKEPSAATEKL